MSTSEQQYDVIVIGTGPIGQTVADARRVAGARDAVSGPVNAAAVFERRDGYVTNWDDSGQAARLKGIGADLFRGHARLDGPAG